MIGPLILYFLYITIKPDLIESKMYKPSPPQPKKKSPQNACIMFFENKDAEFINIARTVCDTDIVPSPPVKFPKTNDLQTAYKLTPPISTKFFSLHQFVSNLDLNLFLKNPDILPCKCNNSSLIDGQHKHIM